MSGRSCSAGEATPAGSASPLARDLPAILNAVTDRRAELDRLGRGHDAEAVLLDRLLDLGIEAVERGVLAEVRGPHDPPRFAWPDRPAPFPNEAA